MLHELHIRDIALIKDAWIEPGDGFTVFTGETGAGKTVLLSALKLIVGERGDTTLIRHGADDARIEARFDDDLVATRQFSLTGRNRCTLADEMVTVGRLSEVLGPTIDLHGQHDHQALLHPATHAGVLDRWGGETVEMLLSDYRHALDTYREAVAHRDELVEAIEKSATEIETGRIALAEIECVDPQKGEDDALTAQLPALQHAGEVAEAIRCALEALREDEGAIDRIARAGTALEDVAGFDAHLKTQVESLSTIAIELDEITLALRTMAESLPHAEEHLEEVQTRLGALDGLKRRFGPSLDSVLDRRERLKELVALTEGSDERLQEAIAQVENSKKALKDCASALHDARAQSARALAVELEGAVASLDMADASFEITCEMLDFDAFTQGGPDRIEILYRPTPSTAMRPLAKIASGGEISRVMLALRTVLGDTGDATLLVFDEIDAGIGGATATLIGKRLARLAQTHQVIVVTHLAQVAVFADTHYVVDKQSHDGEVATTVRLVTGEEREHEIARMLSGETGQPALEHARELLANACV